MKDNYKNLAAGIIFALSALEPSLSVADNKPQDRPYKSENETIDIILDRYWNDSPYLECGKGEFIEVPNGKTTYSFMVEAECMPGAIYYMLHVTKRNGEYEYFIDSNLDGKLNDEPLYSTLPDMYTIENKKGIKAYNVGETPKKDWDWINKKYTATITKIAQLIKK